MSLISLTDYRPMPRYDEGGVWTGALIEGAVVEEGPWSTIETVAFSETDSDPTKPGERSFTINVEAPDVAWLRVVFVDEDGQQDVTNPVPTSGVTAELATIRDVARRLGRFLSDSEEVQVNSLIGSATDVIYAAVDKPSEWQPTHDQRGFLNGLCVELVTRGMANPHALYALTESLGQHSVTQSYSRDIAGGGLMLLPAEELAARRVVWATTNGSARARSLANDVADAKYGDDIIDGTAEEDNGGELPPGAVVEVSGFWDYSVSNNPPPGAGQIRTIPDPPVIGQAMTIYLSAQDDHGVYWSDPTLGPGDELRLRGSAGAVQHCRITSFELTVPGEDGYATIITTLESSTGPIAKNATVEVTLIRE